MKTKLHLKPGQKGTKRLVAQYGDRLVCVRYRYDEQKKKRFKTVELIVEETDWEPKQCIRGDTIVGISIAVQEKELRNKVKSAGGQWNREEKVWNIRYEKVVELELLGRMVDAHSSDKMI